MGSQSGAPFGISGAGPPVQRQLGAVCRGGLGMPGLQSEGEAAGEVPVHARAWDAIGGSVGVSRSGFVSNEVVPE